MRPPLFLSAGAMAALTTFGAVTFAQTPPSSAAPPAPSAAPAAPTPPAVSPSANDAAPSAPPRGAPPAGASPPSPLPGASPPGPLPGASPAGPPGPEPPIYGPPPGGAPRGYTAQPYYAPPYGAPPPPAVPPDARSHSGFFLRMALGGGYVANASTLDGPTYQGKVDATGGAIGLELSIGGALSPGLILAGSYTFHTVGNAKLANDSRTVRPAHDPRLTMLAVMLDVYPNPKQGFHLGGALGLAAVQVRADEDPLANGNDEVGFGLAPHVGYEWWVGNYWGLGVMGKFLLARSEADYGDGKVKDTLAGAVILFSATYN